MQGKHSAQAIGQGRGDEAGPASRQEINPQVRIRSSDGNQGQTDPSDHQAGPWWHSRHEVKPESQPTGPDQQGPWSGKGTTGHNTLTTELRQGP